MASYRIWFSPIRSADSHSQLVFIDRIVTINTEYYRENVSNTVLTTWADKHFGRRPWTFQQGSPTPKSVRVKQEWLENKVLLFISTTQWPLKSLDLIGWNCAPAFWRVRFSLKKYQIADQNASTENGLKTRINFYRKMATKVSGSQFVGLPKLSMVAPCSHSSTVGSK